MIPVVTGERSPAQLRLDTHLAVLCSGGLQCLPLLCAQCVAVVLLPPRECRTALIERFVDCLEKARALQ